MVVQWSGFEDFGAVAEGDKDGLMSCFRLILWYSRTCSLADLWIGYQGLLRDTSSVRSVGGRRSPALFVLVSGLVFVERVVVILSIVEFLQSEFLS